MIHSSINYANDFHYESRVKRFCLSAAGTDLSLFCTLSLKSEDGWTEMRKGKGRPSGKEGKGRCVWVWGRLCFVKDEREEGKRESRVRRDMRAKERRGREMWGGGEKESMRQESRWKVRVRRGRQCSVRGGGISHLSCLASFTASSRDHQKHACPSSSAEYRCIVFVACHTDLLSSFSGFISIVWKRHAAH